MKRSDMVLKIAECLIEPHHEDTMDEASYILKRLELLGMAPPSILNPHFQGGTNIDIHPYYVQEWEEE